MRLAASRAATRPFQVVLVILVATASSLAAGIGAASAQTPAQRWDGHFELISGNRPALQAPVPANAPTPLSGHSVSADGRWAIFRTEATNLTFQGPATYLLDRHGTYPSPVTGATGYAVISGDGQHYAYQLCWGGTAECDIFAFDRRIDASSKLTQMPNGTGSNGTSLAPVLSSTGRFVVFLSNASNVTGTADGVQHVIFRDRDPDGNGTYDEPGSTVDVITAGGDAASDSAEVSADGRFVAFRSRASNLVAGDVTDTWDVFLHDRQTAETRRLNVRSGGEPSLAEITEPHISMSADGRFVAFASADPDLVPLAYGDTNDGLDVFVYDRQTSALSRVDIGRVSGGLVPGNGPSSWPTLSADGRYVALQSAATDVDVPPAPGSTQVWVFDRVLGQPTRISVLANGSEPGQSSVQPAISGDGSLVLFLSTATTFLGIAPPAASQIVAASHLSVSPSDLRIPGWGGSRNFTVTAQAHTRWEATEYPDAAWLPFTPPAAFGNGSLWVTVSAANPLAQARSATVRIGRINASVTQEAGLTFASISPTQGTKVGGTLVTITGTGLDTAVVTFGSSFGTIQSRTATTIVVSTPPRGSNPPVVSVSVHGAGSQMATLANAFEYTGDETPPVVYGTLAGPLGTNGWYVGNVTVTWTVADPESAITSTTCSNATLYYETSGTTVSCSATSEGGTTSASVSFKRDSTLPAVTVTSPTHGDVVAAGAVVPGTYTCSDARSGVAACGGSPPSGTPIDTASIGLKSFFTSATDGAGNVKTVEIPYGVGTGVCSAAPAGLRSWLRLEGNLIDAGDGLNTVQTNGMLAGYAAGEVGQAFNFASRSYGGVDITHGGRLGFSNRLSIAFWMRPTSPFLGTLVELPGQLRLNYIYDDKVSWVMETPLQPSGWTSIAGGSVGRAPVAAWTHVVVTFDAGELRLYLNGRLDTSWSGLQASLMQPTYWSPARLGTGPNGYVYTGRLDEVQFFNRPLGGSEIAGLYLAGTHGVCPPSATTLVAAPITTTYGAGTFEATAVLRDSNGVPLPGKTIAFWDVNSARTANLSTDATGTVRWPVPFTLSAGTYTAAIRANYHGEPIYTASAASATVTVQKAMPVITWPTPAAITYGTAIGAAQLNATVNVAGTKIYTPAAGVVLDAGLQPLQVAFTPTSTQNYNPAASTVTLEVRKAVPAMTLTGGGTFTFDGQPHAATAAATDYRGVALTPVTLTYNGAAAAPVDAGVYTVEATFPGDANHEARTVTTTVTIAKATPGLTFAPLPATWIYDGQPHALTATVTGLSGAPIGTATVTYDGASAVPVNAGIYAVSATYEGSTNYAAQTATAALRIDPATPALTVTGGAFTYDGQPHPAVVAAAGIGGEVPPGALTITYNAGSAVPVGAGTYAVSASIAAAGNYTAATGSAVVTIGRATPLLAWNTPTPVLYGTPLDATQLNATASVPGTFTYSPAPGSVLSSGDAHPLTATFTPADTGNYEGGSVSTTIAVLRATPAIGVTGGTFTYDGQPHGATATATGGGVPLTPVTITYDGSTAMPVDAGIYAVEATFAGDDNHVPGSASGTLTIGRAAVILSWSGPAPIAHGTPLGAAQLAAQASVPGTFGYTPGPGAVLAAGSHTLSATFTPADTRNYDGATVSTTLLVERAPATVTAIGGSFAYDGGSHPATASATGVGGVALTPLTVTYNGSTIAPVAVGTYAVVATFAGDQNREGATATATITIGKGTPVLSWAQPASLPYGPTLSATQLNAQASVPGTFSYSPGLANRLPAGTHTLTATFTPTDAANYTGGTVTTSITIVPAPLEIRMIDTAKPFGAPLPAFTASYTGLASGQTAAVLSGTLVFSTAATAASPLGSYIVTPSGLSSPNYAITFVSGSLTVVKAPVTVTLTVSPTPSGLDMPITFGVTVAATQGAPTAPTGTVRIFDGATLLGTATLSGGTATLITGGLTAGSHTIEARYDGAASFDVGARTATHVVNTAAATPAITLTTSRQPASTTQSMTFTATITVATSGTIAFYDGGTLLGSGSIAAGRATLTVTSLPAGSHAITARFQGNASAPPVISPVLVQSVTSGGWKDRTSTVALVSSANPSALGAAVTFTATASGSSGTPTGRILFMVDGLVVGDPAGVAMSGSGQASVSLSTLNGGRHKVTATYLGNSNYRGSNGAVTQTVD